MANYLSEARSPSHTKIGGGSELPACKHCPPEGDPRCVPLHLLLDAFPKRDGLAAGASARLKFEADADALACNSGNVPIAKALELVGDVAVQRNFGDSAGSTLAEAVGEFVVSSNRAEYDSFREELLLHAESKLLRAVARLGKDTDKRIRRYDFRRNLFGYVHQEVRRFAVHLVQTRRFETISNSKPAEFGEGESRIHSVSFKDKGAADSDKGKGAADIEFAVIVSAYQAAQRIAHEHVKNINAQLEKELINQAIDAVNSDHSISQAKRDRIQDAFRIIVNSIEWKDGYCVLWNGSIDLEVRVPIHIETAVSPKRALEGEKYRDNPTMLIKQVIKDADRALGILAADPIRAPLAHQMLVHIEQERKHVFKMLTDAIHELASLANGQMPPQAKTMLGPPVVDQDLERGDSRWGYGIANLPFLFALMDFDLLTHEGLRRLLFYDSSGGKSA